MMKQSVLCVVCAVFALTGALVSARAEPQDAKYNKVVRIGEKAPSFTKLTGVDGKSHSLKDLKTSKAVVVIFTCNHCPIAQAYEERLIRLTSDYKKWGLSVVAISVSHMESDGLQEMKKHANEHKFNFPYLQDLSQDSARNLGATSTPHVFLLDGKRKIVYMGAIDDDWTGEKVEKPYLRDAVDAVLSGKKVAISESRQMGCQIEYVRKRR
ncbi:MAG: thioredoxin family protein [Planctomycetaceae bacterium]|nr:thioredoxin family protein [Planctomycetaceae bacterium]